MTVRSQIPHGSILAQLRQRQMDKYAAAERARKEKKAFTNQMIQLGGMAAGGALAIPSGGLSLAPMMTGASIGGLGGGLLGNAVTGTPTSANQAVNAALGITGMIDRQARTGEFATRTEKMSETTSLETGMKEWGEIQGKMDPGTIASYRFDTPGGGALTFKTNTKATTDDGWRADSTAPFTPIGHPLTGGWDTMGMGIDQTINGATGSGLSDEAIGAMLERDGYFPTPGNIRAYRAQLR